MLHWLPATSRSGVLTHEIFSHHHSVLAIPSAFFQGTPDIREYFQKENASIRKQGEDATVNRLGGYGAPTSHEGHFSTSI